MDNLHAIASIAVMAIITAALRSLPFLIFGGKRKTPKVITYLGTVLPYAVMGMLVVYCMKDQIFASVTDCVPLIIASSIVVFLYIWRRNTLLSIIAGTVSYMLLVQLIFV